MFRPLGALLFGFLGDRFGRRIPLMVDIIFYSVIELLTAFSPNFTVFLILRALFGIGMGGEWGLGASLLMETLPAKARGLFSGILQQGYAFGFLLAAIVYWLVFPHFGWRGLFVAGTAPALLVIFIRMRVPESPSWERQKKGRAPGRMGLAIRQHWKLFLYAILLMTAFNCMSHGTQDLYPTFLQKQCGLDVSQVRNVSIIYSLGAICGGTIFGALSQTWGRRRSIIAAAAIGILLIPAWIFSPSLGMLIAGGVSACSSWCKARGGGAGASQRTFARGNARDISGIRLSARESVRGADRRGRGEAGGKFSDGRGRRRLCEVAGDRDADCFSRADHAGGGGKEKRGIEF